MTFNMKKAKENEKRVAKVLAKATGGAFAMNHNLYGVWDLLGKDQEKSYLVEVKERRQVWETFFIEEKKVLDLLEAKEELAIDQVLLVVSVDGKDFVYDVEDIATHEVVTVNMNRRTAKDIGGSEYNKINKRVYEFPTNSTMLLA